MYEREKISRLPENHSRSRKTVFQNIFLFIFSFFDVSCQIRSRSVASDKDFQLLFGGDRKTRPTNSIIVWTVHVSLAFRQIPLKVTLVSALVFSS